MSDRLTLWAKKHPAGIAIGTVVAFLAFVSYLRNVEYWRKYFDSFLQYAISINPTTKELTSRAFFFYPLLALVGIFVTVAALLVQSEVRRREAVNSKDEEGSKSYLTLQGMMRAANRIRNQLTPAAQAPRKAFDSVKLVYEISKDFTVAVQREYEMRAVNTPLHFWGVSYQATGHADPAEYLLDIDFHVKPEEEVVYLPIKNDPLCKGVCFYFLPRLEPGKPARKLAVSYMWPKLLKQLKVKGEEEIGINLDSAESIKDFTLEIYLEEGSGGVMECEKSGGQFEGATLITNKHKTKNWPGFIYTVKNAPAGRSHFAVMLRFKKT
jgi:hypothetical protein